MNGAINIEYTITPKHKHDFIQPEGDLIQSNEDDEIHEESLGSSRSNIETEENQSKLSGKASGIR